MQKGILASLFVLVTSLIWYGYWSHPLDTISPFPLPSMQTQSLKRALPDELKVMDTLGPINSQCGDGYCTEGTEDDRTSFNCCSNDCGASCLYDECVAPRDLMTQVGSIPFGYDQTFTCHFPDNYLVNRWRIKLIRNDNKRTLFTDWSESNQLTASFYALGNYEIICQGAYINPEDTESNIDEVTIEAGIIDGCSTQATFMTDTPVIDNETIIDSGEVVEDELTDAETTSGESQPVSCDFLSQLPESDYLRERLIGVVADELCDGVIYHSKELQGVAGICCPKGMICDLNCDYQVDTTDLLLIDKARDQDYMIEIPEDGIDNSCDGQIDCGENPVGYCSLPLCDSTDLEALETTFATQEVEPQEVWIVPDNPDIVEGYMISSSDSLLILAVTRESMDGQAYLEILRRDSNSAEWEPLGFIEERLEEQIILKGVDIIGPKEYLITYQLDPSQAFKIQKYKYGLRQDISPNF